MIGIVVFILLVWYFFGRKKKYPPIDDDVSERRVKEISKKIQNDVRGVFYEAKKKGINLRLTDGFRSFEKQDELYEQGRTKPGAIVTNARGGQSYHNYGLAFDVVDLELLWDGADWETIGEIGKSFGFEWGGDWGWDKPHFQKTFGKSTSELREEIGNSVYA